MTELEALLSVMSEGVMILSVDERVVRMNEAAALCLGVDASASRGRFLQEVVRNARLQEFVSHMLQPGAAIPGGGRMIEEKGRQLLARGTALREGDGAIRGVIIILHDETRVSRLETMRRDFVANVSHELKTPITSIKGYLETLRDGAIHDPENSMRFLDITLKQADRLNAIIEDLLSLSRIEQDVDRGEFPLEPGDVRPLIASVIQICEPRAADHRVRLETDIREDLVTPMNPLLLEQAVVNLVDNAVKHSEPGGVVRVEASLQDGDAVIRVIDRGIGIPAEHLPRLFERFYRVDKARSRKGGGTGLGLAIVKHIVQAHHGTITVESIPGKGSTFTIRCPARDSSHDD